MRLARAILRAGFERTERGLDLVFGPDLNPLAQLGALGFFYYWIVAVSGIYLYIGFDTSVAGAYPSVEHLTHAQWYAGGVMRSFHRYASDALVAVMLLHITREFSLDRYRGVRWFSWITGIPILWLVYASGITGYWLVWDKLAQYVAIATTELLDWLPIFGEPIARNFLTPGSLTDRFFTLLVFLHIAVPLILLFVLWVHLQRISQPKINPPRLLAAGSALAMLALALWKPALSQGAADLATVPARVGLDWFYLTLYPIAELWSRGAVWGVAAAITFILAALPWLPPFRKPAAAVVTLDHCNGCSRCIDDCPYAAITLAPRSDGKPFSHEVRVSPNLCVGCGICMGACPSSTPFRRAAELATGIDLPDLPLRAVREETHEAALRCSGSPRLLAFGCEHAADAAMLEAEGIGIVKLRCIAMIPPSLIDYVLSRGLAEGVVLVGCAESACYNRLGVRWTKARIGRSRDPRLRTRTPRERILTVWAAPSERARVLAEVRRFQATVGVLPAEPAPTATEPAAREENPVS